MSDILIQGLPPRRIAVSVVLTLAAITAVAADDLRNWGHDPFMQLSHDAADCPAPRGPLMNEQDWKAEAHWRIETGTSCWLAGTCADSNAFRYDAALSQSLFPALASAHDALVGSSVWVYVQRRIVFIQGCVKDDAQANALEALARQAPNEVMVVPSFRVGADGRVPYRLMPTPPR